MKTKVIVSILFLTLQFNNSNFAQNNTMATGTFIRVYNLEGEKFDQGKIISISDTLLLLKSNNRITSVNPNTVGLIKTKRSIARNMIIGGTIGVAAGAVVGANNAHPDDWLFPTTASEQAVYGAILGGGLGTGIGALTLFLKKPTTFLINGNSAKWKIFQGAISN
ncbi:hypothetical protein ES711_05095 [Gelidibacter salicanalis]|uniref:Glycine zipper family protein n=1 Tax=Gelidibacter salicanalis TaxID=291193 RepID=A0A5C7ALN4_9FLAO|nr:hypothetical protein [Gelidibacter salicanalis]TXE09307.1 hypothetical protein ES711_05095 [Gelidibacter salicanalis]